MKTKALTTITIALATLGCDIAQPRARQAWTTWWGISTLYVAGYTPDGIVSVNPRDGAPDCEAEMTPAEADQIAQAIEDYQDSALDITIALQSGDQVTVETAMLTGEWTTSMTTLASGAEGQQYFCRMHLYPQASWLEIAADMHDAAAYASGV